MVDNLKIEDLITIEKAGLLGEIKVAELLPEHTPEKKIEELVMNWIIPQSDLDSLVERKLLSKEQKKELEDKLNDKAEKMFYDRMFSAKREIELEEQTKGEKNKPSKHQRKTVNPKTEQIPQEENLHSGEEVHRFFEGLGEIFDNLGNVTFTGSNRNSLNGYRIYSSKELGVVVFVKKDEPNNATYIMSLAQACFIFRKLDIANENGTVDTTKAEIRARAKGKIPETEQKEDKIITQNRGKSGIQVLNESPAWELNLLRKICKVAKGCDEKKEIQRLVAIYEYLQEESMKRNNGDGTTVDDDTMLDKELS